MVAAVIPTRDRLDGLRAAVSALGAQTRRPDRILVVDDSTRPATAAWLARQAGLATLRAPEGGGAPGGFQAGIDAALERGAEWIWLIDDDCVPEPGALEALLAVAGQAGHSGALGGVVPSVRFGDGRLESGWRVGASTAAGRGQEAVIDPRPGDPVDAAPFAGLLLAAAACRDAGPLRVPWFLWHADVEYCLRLRLAGWSLLAAPGASVWHPSPAEHVRRVGPREVRVADFAPWREYYDTRNLVPLRRMTAGTAFDDRPPARSRVVREAGRTAAVLIADPAGARRIGMRILGAVDGLLGRMDRHPERNPRWR